MQKLIDRIARRFRIEADDCLARVRRVDDLMTQGMSQHDALESVSADVAQGKKRWVAIPKNGKAQHGNSHKRV